MRFNYSNGLRVTRRRRRRRPLRSLVINSIATRVHVDRETGAASMPCCQLTELPVGGLKSAPLVAVIFL